MGCQHPELIRIQAIISPPIESSLSKKENLFSKRLFRRGIYKNIEKFSKSGDFPFVEKK